MTGLRRVVGIAILSVVALAGCRAVGSIPDSQMKLSASNNTNLGLEIVVNGSRVADLPAGQQVELAAVRLPPLPWTAIVRFPNGRELLSLIVRSGDVTVGANSQSGDGARVDLSCGRIDMWSGPPMLGPMPGAGTLGDCLR